MKNLLKALSASIVAAALLSGCGPAKLPDLVWPAPPEKPRIKFVKSYIGPSDFKKSSIITEVLLGPELSQSLVKPAGIHVDKNGKIYVTDTALGSVFILDPINSTSTVLTVKGRAYFAKPVGITTDDTGRVFVADSRQDMVTVFDKNGNYLQVLGDEVKFKQPTGVTVDNERNKLYVADTHRHVVEVFDLTSLNHLKTLGGRGKEEGSFNYPSSMAVGADGTLYVTDTMNGRVQVFDPEGRHLMSIGQFGDGPGMFARPKGIAVDSENHIYVVDAAFNNVQIFNEEGQILMAFGGFGSDRGLMVLPSGMAIDKDDYIYVVDSWNERINIYEFLGTKHGEREAKKVKLVK